MNIYLLTRINEDIDYDSFASAVVLAESEQQARETHPNDHTKLVNGKWIDVEVVNGWEDTYSWTTNLSNIEVKLLGTAIEGSVAGPVCSSFNAG